MIFKGNQITCETREQNFAELRFDAPGPVNKFDLNTISELSEAIQAVVSDKSIAGLIFSSGKETFIVGADIKEFLGIFAQGEERILSFLGNAHKVFNMIEDLNIPTVSVLNGYTLGGGMELALCTDFRIAIPQTKLGFPEVTLGLFPGFGGLIRFSRLTGADNAIEWICQGSEYKAQDAMKIGVLDAIVSQDQLINSAIDLLKQARSNKLDWQSRSKLKKSPLQLDEIESMMAFETSKAFVAAKAGKSYPTSLKAIHVMQKSAGMERDQALEVEKEGFVKVAVSDTTKNLINIFLNDQFIKKISKQNKNLVTKIHHAAVLGAGIMGGGIAYQTSFRGKIPVIMKDINQEAIQLGLNEASKLLKKLVSRGKITVEQMAAGLNQIQPTLSYNDIANVDMTIEAVIENQKIKQSVLCELEDVVSDTSIIASNTSTISISKLAKDMKHPERFVGMHFFNPVHRMPLVEVIRCEKSSDKAIATTMDFATQLGKKPILVNDCPGFLVNRVLFPYFHGFLTLLNQGADFQAVDKVMESFGWPMGPAYLNDVVGMDTSFHAASVLSEAYPDRLKSSEKTVLDIMYENKRFGQKAGKGFYKYELDKKGKPKKTQDPDTNTLIAPITGEIKTFEKEEIVDYLMLPLLFESARSLEENIVSSPQEVDMGLIYGLGFPAFPEVFSLGQIRLGSNQFVKNPKNIFT